MEFAPTLLTARERARLAKLAAARQIASMGEEENRHHRLEKAAGVDLWGPLLLGICLAAFATYLWNQSQWVWGQLGPLIVFPYLLLSSRPELGMSQDLASHLSHYMLYLQFPLEGLIVTLGIARGHRISGALARMLVLHGLGVFVVWLLFQRVALR